MIRSTFVAVLVKPMPLFAVSVGATGVGVDSGVGAGVGAGAVPQISSQRYGRRGMMLVMLAGSGVACDGGGLVARCAVRVAGEQS